MKKIKPSEPSRLNKSVKINEHEPGRFIEPREFKVSLLRITFFSGLILLLLIGGILTVIFAGGNAVSRGIGRESMFHRLLREYDFKSRQILEIDSDTMRRRELERLDSDLDRLEKQAEGVESWLSILKRRRQLAKLDFRYEQSYRGSSQRAARAFPYSETIAAIAAAALIHNAAIPRESEIYLREISPLLVSPRFTHLRLSLHVLLGDFKSPEKAASSLPRDFTMPEYLSNLTPETEIIFSDLAILKILAGDIPAAAIDIQAALNASAPGAAPSPALVRLAAECFYDFGNLLRSAELFSMLPDEVSLSRQADALWLAGYTDNARAIWAMQTAQDRPLYNLALTAPTLEKEAELLERLVKRSRPDEQRAHGDSIRRFSLIRLSRFFEASRAITILNAESAAADSDPANALIALEILRRWTEIGEMPRMIAETWLLLERYPDLEDLYEWGAWYFNLQRIYTESAKLLQIAARHNFSGYWMDMYKALQHIREGNPSAAEEMLAGLAAESGHWAAMANVGRLIETRHAPARALEHYEQAMAALMESDKYIASRIQVRIAFCLKSLGRIEESRRALNYALDLNPDNLSARVELDRLE